MTENERIVKLDKLLWNINFLNKSKIDVIFSKAEEGLAYHIIAGAVVILDASWLWSPLRCTTIVISLSIKSVTRQPLL